jgi:predicted DNA-binding transcriptional regulator AlpA
MPQLELAPELKELNPQFESADATGPSVCFSVVREVFAEFERTSGTIDRALPVRGGGGKSFGLYVYREAVVDALERGLTLELEREFHDLPSAIEATRRTSALPVNEVAEMMGLSRRGLYKIINEGRTAAATEEHILRIADIVSRLLDELGETHLVRAALLTPLRALGDRTFIEIAGTRDEDDIRAATEALLGSDGRAAIEKQWRRTRPLGPTGEAASRFIEEGVERPT